jgi:hypothetical protein
MNSAEISDPITSVAHGSESFGVAAGYRIT